MSRWKPKKGDWYYYIKFNKVFSVPWYEDEMDCGNWDMGNCFKTEEEAEKALEMVKELLLSLHGESGEQ